MKIFSILTIVYYLLSNNTYAAYGAAASKIDAEFFPIIICTLIAGILFSIIIQYTEKLNEHEWKESRYRIVYGIGHIIFAVSVYIMLRILVGIDPNTDGIDFETVIIFSVFYSVTGIFLLVKRGEYNLKKTLEKSFIAIPLHLVAIGLLVLLFPYQKTVESKNDIVIETPPVQTRIKYCNFNGTEYELPFNAHCTINDKVNAWVCDEGFYEAWGDGEMKGKQVCVNKITNQYQY